MQEANEDNTGWRRALRRDMVARRAALSEAEHDVLSARIVAHLIAALPAPQVLAFCWPIKHEPDVRAIVPHWAGFGTQAALPVVVGENAPLAFRHGTMGWDTHTERLRVADRVWTMRISYGRQFERLGGRPRGVEQAQRAIGDVVMRLADIDAKVGA